METGIVKHFNPKRGFGFLVVLDANGNATGEEIFFHFNDAADLAPGLDEPVWWDDCFTKAPKTPEKGDKLVFERAVGKGGRDKACPWAYQWYYDAIVKQIADEREREDFPDRFEECPGGCGQTVADCVCAELESLREWNANPATRGSFWTP